MHEDVAQDVRDVQDVQDVRDVQDVPKPQLSADHLGIAVVPLVVADCAPPSRVKHLHTTFKVFVPSDQPQRRPAA